MRRRNAGGPLDTHAARELELYVENDAQLHRSQEQPIQKNLITKMARGVYNHAGAVKLYGYLMESGAKKYAREHSVGTDWHQIFSPATRKAAAENFAKSFETEAKLGNYDHMLPKKYAGWSGKGINHRVPNGKLIPARIRHKGKTYAGKVKRVNGRVKIYVTPEVARKINPHHPGVRSYSTQIDTSKDFHTLSSSEVEAVLAEADRQKYRKPKSASGSRARYFYQKLQREAARGRR